MDKHELFNKAILGEIAELTISKKGWKQDYKDYKEGVIKDLEKRNKIISD